MTTILPLNGSSGSVVQSLSRVWLCNPKDCSMPGFPVLHYLPELAQNHVRWVGDAIRPFHPLSSPSPAFSLSQHQGLFQWVSSWHQVAKVLELQLQPQSFQWIFRVDFLQDWLVGSPCCPRDPQESSPTPKFESINSLALSFLYGPALTSTHDYWKSHSFDYTTERCKSVFSERCYLDYLICLCCCLFFKETKQGSWVKITVLGMREGHEGSEFQTYLGERGNQLSRA